MDLLNWWYHACKLANSWRLTILAAAAVEKEVFVFRMTKRIEFESPITPRTVLNNDNCTVKTKVKPKQNPYNQRHNSNSRLPICSVAGLLASRRTRSHTEYLGR